MINNSLPLRSDESLIAEYIIWNSNDKSKKFNLFVEDENGELIYRELFEKKYNEEYLINIYTCKSKANVIETFNDWEKTIGEGNVLFIVDKDFAYWTQEKIPLHQNFLQWKYYTIENYFIDKKPAIFLLKVYLKNISHNEIIQAFDDWDEWVDFTFNQLKLLFVWFVIAHKYSLGENSSQSPYKFFDTKNNIIREEAIKKEIEIFKNKCEEKNIKWREEEEKIIHFYDKRQEKGIHELVKGKYYLSYLINEIYVRAKIKKNNLKLINLDAAYSYFILKTPISKFDEFYNKIDKILKI